MPKFAALYQFDPALPQYNGSYAPPASYLKPLYEKLLALSKEYELPWHMQRYLPRVDNPRNILNTGGNPMLFTNWKF